MKLRPMFHHALVAAFVLALPARPAQAVPSPHRAAAGDIVATLRAAGKFTTLLSLIDASGLTSRLQGKGPYTLFAPTDSAFALLSPAKLAALKAPATALATVSYYVVPAQVTAASFTALADAQSYAAFKTLGGADIKVHMARHVGKEFANIKQADLMASNGVIHVVDKVLAP